MEYRTLANGVKMPMLGYGVFQVRDHEQCRQVVKDAISVGYRLIGHGPVIHEPESRSEGHQRSGGGQEKSS